MVPDITADEISVQEHIKSFWEMVNDRREFCHVDNQILLKDTASLNDVLSKIKREVELGTYKNETQYLVT